VKRANAIGLFWKLRRVAADLRQQDVSRAIGISTSRLSGIERGDYTPTELETRLVEQFLPPLPSAYRSAATGEWNGEDRGVNV
jgi:transcriptional regulator with XRE-family HTH domain